MSIGKMIANAATKAATKAVNRAISNAASKALGKATGAASKVAGAAAGLKGPKEETKGDALYHEHFDLLASDKTIMHYVTKLTWSGSLDQAGRRCDFTIGYTKKDKAWQNLDIKLGDTVKLTYEDLLTKKKYVLFVGKVFMQSRASESYEMDFVSYDNLIYLTKSHMTAKYDNVTIKAVIQDVCSTLGVTAGELKCEDLNYTVSFVADDMSGTDIIKKALETAQAWTGWTYHIYMAVNPDSGEQKLEVVRANTKIDDLVLSDTDYVETAKHSTSIEDMVNQVAVVDDSGNTTGYIKNDDDIKKYGLLQANYKYDSKQNTEQSARLLLQKEKDNSEITARGNIQCISGYAVTVKEEQIQGDFLIAADSHSIQGNRHNMSLTLTYIVKPDAAKNATTEGNVNPEPTKKSKKGKIGKGSFSGDMGSAIKAGYDAWAGQTMPDGPNGCVEAVTRIGSWYSPFLKGEYDGGVASVPTLVADAGGNCIPFDSSRLEAGDTIVYGDNDHVVIAAGPSGDYVGNSSSANKVVHGKNFYNMGGLYPTKIIKTSHM